MAGQGRPGKGDDSNNRQSAAAAAAAGTAPAAPSPSNKSGSLRGLFKDGTWFCDCKPAQPCLFLKAKEGGRNGGRHFYRCQADKKTENSCDFFMWADQARGREINFVMTNGRSEKLPQGKQQQGHNGKSADKNPSSTPSSSSSGNRRSWTQTKLDMPIRTRSQRAAAAADAAADPEDGDQASNNNADGDDASSHTASSRTLRSSHSQQQQSTQSNTKNSSNNNNNNNNNNNQGTKRKADFDDFSDFSEGEVEELTAIEKRSGGGGGGGGGGSSTGASRVGSSRTRDAFTTPTVSGGRSIFAAHYYDENDNDKQGNNGGLPTPSTGKSVRRVLFAPGPSQQDHADRNVDHSDQAQRGLPPTPSSSSAISSSSKRQRNTAEGGYTSTTTGAPTTPSHHHHHQQPSSETPTTPGTSFASFTSTPGSGSGSFTGGGGGSIDGSNSSISSMTNLTSEVLELLRDEGIPAAKLQSLRGKLDKFSKRARGLARGRDVTRREMQRLQRDLAEQRQRNAALENSRDLDRAALRAAAVAAAAATTTTGRQGGGA